MRTIYKYPLELKDHQWVTMPAGAQILCVQTQKNIVTLWAVVDTSNVQIETTLIHIVGTGNPITDNENWQYIGTVQQLDNIFVWHVFKEKVAH